MQNLQRHMQINSAHEAKPNEITRAKVDAAMVGQIKVRREIS